MCSKCAPTRRPARRGRRGFSLMEMMAVLLLIGLLAGLVTVSVPAVMAKGKQQAARAQIASFCSALDGFHSTLGHYPSNDEGLASLTQTSDALPEPLLRQIPSDPWGRPYQYVFPGANAPYEIICYGADGREGGDGGDRDITSMEVQASHDPRPVSATAAGK